jgi:hypothetical protein
MEHIANRAGDFTKADHHRKMQEIYKAMKEKQQQRTQALSRVALPFCRCSVYVTSNNSACLLFVLANDLEIML